MLRFVSLVIVIVCYLVANSCDALAQPEPPRNFRQIQAELDQLNADFQYESFEGVHEFDGKSLKGQLAPEEAELIECKYRTTKLLLHHLIYSACYHRDTIIKKALELAKNKPEKEYLYDLHQAHSDAHKAIETLLEKMTQLTGVIEEPKLTAFFQTVVERFRARLERRMYAIEDMLPKKKPSRISYH